MGHNLSCSQFFRIPKLISPTIVFEYNNIIGTHESLWNKNQFANFFGTNCNKQLFTTS